MSDQLNGNKDVLFFKKKKKEKEKKSSQLG